MKKFIIFFLAFVISYANAQTHSATLTWNAPSTTLTVGYNVYRASGTCGTVASCPFTKIQGSINGATLTYVDSNVIAGSIYTYYVTAYDTSGANTESIPSNLVAVTIPSGGGTSGQTPPVSGLKVTAQ